jgi:HEPN domain-containing protein
MGQDKTRIKKIQEYYNLSCNYLESAKINLENELFEPAMFSAIHALELSIKTAFLTKTDEAWKTHNIGGQFGKYF